MSSTNPLLVRTGLPPFDVIEPEHVVPAVQQMLQDALAVVEDVEEFLRAGKEPPTWENLILRLNSIDCAFEYTWGPVGHLFSVRNSDDLREAYEAVLNDVVGFGLRVSQSEVIYNALRQIRDGDEWNKLDSAQQRILTNQILGVEMSGIALKGKERDRFNEIASELSKLSTDFSNNVLDVTREYELDITSAADVDGLPESLKQLASQTWNQKNEEADEPSTPDTGPWQITLESTSFLPFMKHCRNRDLREKLYRAYVTRASSGDKNNAPLISEILQLRQEKAELLGYANFAEFSLAKKMAPNVAAVEKMFSDLRKQSWDAAVRDLEEIRAYAAENGQSQELAHWDIPFWSERLREQKFDYTDEQLRPYFSLERVMDGLFSLCNRLFGITVVEADGEAPVWDPDVRFLKIKNEDGKHIASFYLDPYSRPANKRPGAWMNDCLGRRWADNSLQLPVAHLVCNGTPPVGDKPSLMTFREVETLFHEFGHGLQHMLTTVDHSDAAGISGVEWDAVELPSQFMENWCYHRPTLLGMTAHYETGEPLPEELFDKIVAARTFQSGSQMLRQLQFGMIDIELHSAFDPNGDETIFDVQARIGQKTSAMPPLPESRFLCSFSHIFAGGYAAGYYSYKWAEVLSADAFGAFEEAGLDNEAAIQETGRRFRDTVLAEGGSRHPMEIFADFRGREPNPDALLRHAGLQTK